MNQYFKVLLLAIILISVAAQEESSSDTNSSNCYNYTEYGYGGSESTVNSWDKHDNSDKLFPIIFPIVFVFWIIMCCWVAVWIIARKELSKFWGRCWSEFFSVDTLWPWLTGFNTTVVRPELPQNNPITTIQYVRKLPEVVPAKTIPKQEQNLNLNAINKIKDEEKISHKDDIEQNGEHPLWNESSQNNTVYRLNSDSVTKASDSKVDARSFNSRDNKSSSSNSVKIDDKEP